MAGDEVTICPVSYVTIQQTIVCFRKPAPCFKTRHAPGGEGYETERSRTGGQSPGPHGSATGLPRKAKMRAQQPCQKSLLDGSWPEGSPDQSLLSSKQPVGVGVGRGLFSQSL